MLRILLFLLCCCLWNCGEKPEETPTVALEAIAVQGQELPAFEAPNPAAAELLQQWPEYNALQQAMQSLREVSDGDELAIILDNLIEKLHLASQSEFPMDFETPRVHSRIKVMETFLRKSKAELNYRQDPQESLEAVARAWNALNLQFNVIVNNTLDTELLTDE